jgi:uncharacterized protein YyaL (SSP411 family)
MDDPEENAMPQDSARRSTRPRRWAPVLGAALTLALGVAAWTIVARSQAPGRPGAAPKHTNHLAGETSPYLLQHAHNPVDWYPWGTEALQKAKKENKPIFLSIGYSSCHWCHVMERESFEDDGVAALLNAHFVAIKVDREERPDLDEIYMAAVQMMTGSGGWPMSTFLTPEGKPFFGGTYFPRETFLELLRRVGAAWEDSVQRSGLEQSAARISEAIGQLSVAAPQAGTLTPALPRAAVASYLTDLDPVDGGFGGAPKFPPTQRLALMLAEYRKRPDPRVLHAVTLTLDRMARGGLYDQVGGGFHRYSTDRKWLVPHFEKMLYDNALLAWVYLDAYDVTRRPLYRRIGMETLDFTLRELRDPRGGFRSTLDADSGGGEGRFYLWQPPEVTAVLGPRDGKLFSEIYDITSGGNFEGESIPNLLRRPVEGWARELRMTPSALWTRLDGMRAKLRAARERRARPPLDDKVLTNWNGLMLRALSRAYEVTGAERYRAAAEQAAAFLLSTCRVDGRLRHAYRAGRTQPQAFLEDYSFLAAGLLDLHRATGEDRWLTEARSLVGTMVAQFWDEQTGTLYSTPRGHEQLLARPCSAEDGATPSGQSMAALALLRLARLTGDAGMRSKAQRLLTVQATPMKRYPAAMPTMLLAARQYFTAGEGESPSPTGGRRVATALLGVPPRVDPGDLIPLRLRLTIAPGWHVNAHLPAAGLIGTEVTAPPGAFVVTRVVYPRPETVRLGFSKEPLPVLRGTVAIQVWLKAGAGAARVSAVRLRLRYQACSDRVCEQPVRTVVTAPHPPASGGTRQPERAAGDAGRAGRKVRAQ